MPVGRRVALRGHAEKKAIVAKLIGAIALFSTANTALVTLVVATRLLFGMARDGQMPAVLAAILPPRKTPWVAALVLLAGAAALLPMGRVEAVASLSSLASLLAFTAVHAALIVLRFREPRLARPFRMPIAVGRLPLLPVLGILVAAGLLTQFGRTAHLAGGGAIFVGGALFWVRKRRRPPTKRATREGRGPAGSPMRSRSRHSPAR